MRVRVLFFGMLKDLTGKASDELDLPQGAYVSEVLEHYATGTPGLRKWLPSLAVAVNQEYAGPQTALKNNDEVALLPPVSGGKGRDAPSTSSGQASGQPAERQRCASGHASIVRDAIDTADVRGRIKGGDDGAVVVFEGVVRNQTRGRKTLYLDYEAYEEMALRQMEDLAEQALQQFSVRDVALVHRLGQMEIGETSVLIVVASAHRAAAFAACRWLIDTLKRTVPIWKKEYFEDGAVWADGEPFPREEIRRASGSPGTDLASK